MAIEFLSDLADARLEPYRHLRTRNLTRFSGRFIAESRPLVERLLASSFEIESIVVDAADWSDQLAPWGDSHTVLVVPSQSIEELVGFHFHRGFLACGLRPKEGSWRQALLDFAQSDQPLALGTIGLQDPENLGAILRTCAGLGITHCFLGPGTSDPLSRRALRVSMGASLKVTTTTLQDPISWIEQMRELGIQSVVTSLQNPSVPLEQFRAAQKMMVIVGNEAQGVPEAIQSMADHRVQIPMELEVDSFNVAVATGIVLHALRRLLPGVT